jgi:hypothetical protein
MKRFIIPVINGATGNVTEGPKKVTVNGAREAFNMY